jgi:hypothetical protein
MTLDNMRYKKGDRVKIKSLDWFKENEYSGQGTYDDVVAFLKMTDECCGKELTIDFIFTDERGTGYIMKEPNVFQWRFTDSMIEGLADEPQNKMVSLNKVCEMLYAMLTTQDINDYEYVTAPAYSDVTDFVEDFRKTMDK